MVHLIIEANNLIPPEKVRFCSLFFFLYSPSYFRSFCQSFKQSNCP
ncbi:hypothetical protein BAZOLSSOX_1708 [uncultured Gammaproteobacteria bacterium]|nr:hypothetical protein BAZOLSSOX_1708 [uncultured Gammaproteobacteria bacterium]